MWYYIIVILPFILDELEIIRQIGLNTVHSKKTFPSWKPKKSIDQIFVSSEFEVLTTYVCPVLVSDHLGVVVELKMNRK